MFHHNLPQINSDCYILIVLPYNSIFSPLFCYCHIYYVHLCNKPTNNILIIALYRVYLLKKRRKRKTFIVLYINVCIYHFQYSFLSLVDLSHHLASPLFSSIIHSLPFLCFILIYIMSLYGINLTIQFYNCFMQLPLKLREEKSRSCIYTAFFLYCHFSLTYNYHY